MMAKANSTLLRALCFLSSATGSARGFGSKNFFRPCCTSATSLTLFPSNLPSSSPSLVLADHVRPWGRFDLSKIGDGRSPQGSKRFMSQSPPDTSVVSRCKDKISSALETDQVTVTGAFDDPNGSHIAIEVVSERFEGKRPVQRQQLVYKAIWDEMEGQGGKVHAIDNMICKTPGE